MTADQSYLIDQKTTRIKSLPELVEGSFSQTSLIKETGVVGDQTQFEFSITTQNVIPVGGYLKIEFSDDTFQEPSVELVCLTT